MIRAPIIAAAAFALAACGGGGGDAQAPAAAATQPAAAATTPVDPTPNNTTAVSTPELVAANADVANTALAGNQYVRNVGAFANGGYVVAWLSQDTSGSASLFVQRYDANGAKSGGEIRVAYAVAPQESPAIALLRDASVVVASTANGAMTMHRFDASGAASGSDVVVSAEQAAAQPVLLALADGGVAAGWASAGALHARRFDSHLAPSGGAVDFAPDGPDRNIALKLVAMPDGGFIAGATHRFEGIPYVQYRIGNRDVGALFDSNNGMPEMNTTLLPLADGRFALWSTGSTGGYMQMLDSSGQPVAAATHVAVVPETAGALPDGGWFTVTRQMQGQPDVAQRFDANGIAVGDAIDIAEGMSRPLITASTGSGLAMAWTFTGTMGDADVRMQRIDAK